MKLTYIRRVSFPLKVKWINAMKTDGWCVVPLYLDLRSPIVANADYSKCYSE